MNKLEEAKHKDHVQIIPATLSDYPVIQNMARFYVYDLTRECGFISSEWAIPADGLYESFDFKHYLNESTRRAYLIRIRDEQAGFVLLNQTGTQSSSWNMGEFFIIAKFQEKGIGKAVAHEIWKMHPGPWEVSVIPENKSALAFWRKTISSWTEGRYTESLITIDYDKDQPLRYILNFNTLDHPPTVKDALEIRPYLSTDIDNMVNQFANNNWIKPRITFENYWQEQTANERIVWLAFQQQQFAGYITLKWDSLYPPFHDKKIPEIMDLNVLPPYRNQGVGSALLDVAEAEASKQHAIVGLGVGLYPDYGSAQKLYIKRGYRPDGLGITWNYQRVIPGSQVCLDDDLILWFTKELT